MIDRTRNSLPDIRFCQAARFPEMISTGWFAWHGSFARCAFGRRLGTLLFAGCLLNLASAALAQALDCTETRSLYVPIETVRGPLGIRGETRTQYLDRVYGKGRWREGSDGLAIITEGEEVLRVELQLRGNVTLERVDVVAEARLDYLTEQGASRRVLGHREIGRYRIATDVSGNLSIPLGVMRESGAVLVILSATHVGTDERQALVEAWAHVVPRCERSVLVPDRFTAIRLNRDHANR